MAFVEGKELKHFEGKVIWSLSDLVGLVFGLVAVVFWHVIICLGILQFFVL